MFNIGSSIIIIGQTNSNWLIFSFTDYFAGNGNTSRREQRVLKVFASLLKEVTLKGKNFLPMGANYFV